MLATDYGYVFGYLLWLRTVATLHSYTLDYAPMLLTSRMQLLTISGNSLEHTRKVIAA